MKSKRKFNVALIEFLLITPYLTNNLLLKMSNLSKRDRKSVLGTYWCAPYMFPFLHSILHLTFNKIENYYLNPLSLKEFATLLLLPESILLPESTSTALEVRVKPLFDFIHNNTEENTDFYHKFENETVNVIQSYINLSLSFRDILNTTSYLQKDI